MKNKHVMILFIFLIIICLCGCESNKQPEQTGQTETELAFSTGDEPTWYPTPSPEPTVEPTEPPIYFKSENLTMNSLNDGTFISRINNETNYQYNEISRSDYIIKDEGKHYIYRDYLSETVVEEPGVDNIGQTVSILIRDNNEQIVETTVSFVFDSMSEPLWHDIEVILYNICGDAAYSIINSCKECKVETNQIPVDDKVVDYSTTYIRDSVQDTVYVPHEDEELKRFDYKYNLVKSGVDEEEAQRLADEQQFGTYEVILRNKGYIFVTFKFSDADNVSEIETYSNDIINKSYGVLVRNNATNILDIKTFLPLIGNLITDGVSVKDVVAQDNVIITLEVLSDTMKSVCINFTDNKVYMDFMLKDYTSLEDIQNDIGNRLGFLSDKIDLDSTTSLSKANLKELDTDSIAINRTDNEGYSISITYHKNNTDETYSADIAVTINYEYTEETEESAEG